MYNRLCVTDRSMPFWCVANPLSDPFGGPVQGKPDSLEVAHTLAWAKTQGLIEATSFHDDDLVRWNPDRPDDDLDPSSETYKRLHEIRAVLRKAGVKVNAATCSLHGNPLFRAGGLTNPDPRIRALAAKKVERTLRIGALLGARHYIYWVARDGFESYPGTDFSKVYDWLAAGLDHVTDYIESQKLTNYKGATVEPKPNEPRGQMFLPTAGHAVGFIMTRLKKPEFWGVNPELLQHEGMTLLNSVMTVSYLCAVKKQARRSELTCVVRDCAGNAYTDVPEEPGAFEQIHDRKAYYPAAQAVDKRSEAAEHEPRKQYPRQRDRGGGQKSD